MPSQAGLGSFTGALSFFCSYLIGVIIGDNGKENGNYCSIPATSTSCAEKSRRLLRLRPQHPRRGGSAQTSAVLGLGLEDSGSVGI